jgi:hypothetical protein
VKKLEIPYATLRDLNINNAGEYVVNLLTKAGFDLRMHITCHDDPCATSRLYTQETMISIRHKVPDDKICCEKLYPNGVIGEGMCKFLEKNPLVGLRCKLFSALILLNDKDEPKKCVDCLASIIY